MIFESEEFQCFSVKEIGNKVSFIAELGKGGSEPALTYTCADGRQCPIRWCCGGRQNYEVPGKGQETAVEYVLIKKIEKKK